MLAASGLLIRTLVHLETLPRGFDPAGVLTARAPLDDARFHSPATFEQLIEDSTAAMHAIPGVESAAVGLTLPYQRALNDGVTIKDGPLAGKQSGTDVVYVSPMEQKGDYQLRQIPEISGAMVVEDPHTGRVLAMVGGF